MSADWKTHKKSCCKNIGQQADVLGKSLDPFDPAETFAEQHLCQFVPLIDGKGAGVVAKTLISAGEIIVQDKPLMILMYIDGKELGVSDRSSPATAKEKFQQLSENQAKVLSLEDSQTNNKLARAIVDRGYADGSIKSPWEKLYTLSSVPSTPIPEIQDPRYKSAEGIFQTNCLLIGDSNSLGLFPLISRFNHSCCPNAGYCGHPENDEVQVVQAMRDIQPDEENCVSYFNGYFMTSDMRLKRTMMGWGFQCQCEACQPAGLKEAQDLVRSADDGHMSDADMAALIGPDKMALRGSLNRISGGRSSKS